MSLQQIAEGSLYASLAAVGTLQLYLLVRQWLGVRRLGGARVLTLTVWTLVPALVLGALLWLHLGYSPATATTPTLPAPAARSGP